LTVIRSPAQGVCAVVPYMDNKERRLKFGSWLRMRREQLGLTSKQVASVVGVSQEAITYYENGRNMPRRSRMFALADALRVPLSLALERGGFAHIDADQQEAERETILEALRRLPADRQKWYLQMIQQDVAFLTQFQPDSAPQESDD